MSGAKSKTPVPETVKRPRWEAFPVASRSADADVGPSAVIVTNPSGLPRKGT
jgi:hypothetical protein